MYRHTCVRALKAWVRWCKNSVVDVDQFLIPSPLIILLALLPRPSSIEDLTVDYNPWHEPTRQSVPTHLVLSGLFRGGSVLTAVF